jgi:hypothetical protein
LIGDTRNLQCVLQALAQILLERCLILAPQIGDGPEVETGRHAARQHGHYGNDTTFFTMEAPDGKWLTNAVVDRQRKPELCICTSSL